MLPTKTGNVYRQLVIVATNMLGVIAASVFASGGSGVLNSTAPTHTCERVTDLPCHDNLGRPTCLRAASDCDDTCPFDVDVCLSLNVSTVDYENYNFITDFNYLSTANIGFVRIFHNGCVTGAWLGPDAAENGWVLAVYASELVAQGPEALPPGKGALVKLTGSVTSFCLDYEFNTIDGQLLDSGWRYDIAQCNAVAAGNKCEADTECGTNDDLSNCELYDIYDVPPPPKDKSKSHALAIGLGVGGGALLIGGSVALWIYRKPLFGENMGVVSLL